MFTKTLRKRIALVAVSAMGFGLLTSASADAAALTVGTGATNTAFTQYQLNIANKTHATTAAASATIGSNLSVGLSAYDSSVGSVATQTASMDESGVLAFYTGGDNVETMVVASGGTVSNGVGAGGTTTVTRNDSNTAMYTAATTSLSGLWTPGAPGTYTLKLYTHATAVDQTFASLTGGTLRTTITVTVRPTSGLTQYANGVSGTIGVVTAGSDDYSRNQTVTITSDGGLGFATLGTGTDAEAKLTVSGGTIKSVSAVTDGSPSADKTSLVFGDVALDVVVVPNVGATTMIIKSYKNSTNYSSGTVSDKITVTVVAAASIGALDIGESKANLVANTATATSLTDADITGIDTLGASVVANDSYGVIVYQLRDANDVALPTTATVTAESSSADLLVSFDNSFYAQSVAQANPTYGNVYFAQATSGKPASGTITFKYNGTTVWTKSVTVQGDIASIALTSVRSTGKTGVAGSITNAGSTTDASGATATANAGAFTFVAKDSAGNVLGGKTLSVDTTRYNASVSTVTLDNSGATVKYSATAGLTAGPGLGETLGTWTCTSVAGSSKIRLKVTNAAYATVYSNELDANCAGDPNTYTASLDKTSYVPGDIATLTITAKTSAGTNTYSGAVLGTDTTAELAITGSQMTAVVTPQNEDTFGNTGSKTYKFTVGTTEGSYNMIVDLPKWNVAAGYAGAAQTVSYKVAASSSSVTNAEVLAAIVKLIASINKQIAALQKALKK